MHTETILENRETDIAIIGIAVRYSGTNNLQEFWNIIKSGKNVLRDTSHISTVKYKTQYSENLPFIYANTLLENAEYFDADFFNINRREAELMNPEHRVFYECIWQALEDAGYNPFEYKGLIGLYGGVFANYYLYNNVMPSLGKNDIVSEIQTMITNEKDHLTTYAAYKLNFRGPVVTVQTACSSSLAAIHLGCESLITYSSDMIVAGAVTISIPQIPGYYMNEGGLLSNDGYCKPFDKDASGTVYSDGVGVVILKRFEDAIKDKDNIYAVIKGSALNNDGSARVGYAAPGVKGQMEVISRAQRIAGINPESIGYVEAHGTGTPLGDSIELEALHKVFESRTTRKNYCCLGSVKANIGHTGPASGILGFIKTILCLKEKQFPPQINFENASDDWNLNNSPFYINTILSNWETDNNMPRRAAVSSFGLGGTNVHVILEEAPKQEEKDDVHKNHLILLSAKSKKSLYNNIKQLYSFLKENDSVRMSNLAYTLQLGRNTFNHKLFLFAKTKEQVLKRIYNAELFTQFKEEEQLKIGFLLPDENTIDIYFIKKLCRSEVLFKDILETEMRKVLNDQSSILEVLIEKYASNSKTLKLLLIIVQYALSKFWIALDIQPCILIGTGSGIYASIILSEILSINQISSLILSDSEDKVSMLLKKMKFGSGIFNIIDQYTGNSLIHEQMLEPDFWLKNRNLNVRESTDQSNSFKELTLLEISHNTQTHTCQFHSVFARNSNNKYDALYENIGEIWLHGFKIKWENYYKHYDCRRISLPSYAFDRQRYWLKSPHKSTNHLSEIIHSYTYLTEDQLQNYTAPESELEKKLVKIWEDELGIKPVGVTDSFYELGGNSLLGIKIHKRIEEELSITISIKILFEIQTIRSFTQHLSL